VSISAAATLDGSKWEATLDGATTRTLPVGSYEIELAATDGTDAGTRILDTGTAEVVRSLVVDEPTMAEQTFAEKMVEKIRARLLEMADDAAGSISEGGVSISYVSRADLMRQLRHYERQVEGERRAARLGATLGSNRLRIR